MKAREYEVLKMAIDQGVTCGWRRAHKHNESPDAGVITDAIIDAVTNAICEWFTFDDVEE